MNRLEYKYTLPKRIEDNLMLCFFKLAVQSGLTVFNLIDGLVDEFEDETGVDTGASTSEVYDGTNDLYSPVNSGNTVTQQQTLINDYQDLNPSDFTKFAQGFKVSNANKITKFTFQLNRVTGNETGTLTGYIYSDDGAAKPLAILSTFSSIDVSTIALVATDYDFTGAFIPVVGVQYHIVVVWTSGAGTGIRQQQRAANVYFDGNKSNFLSGAWAATGWDTYFKIFQDGIQNMTLISNAVTAEAQPNQGRIVLFEEDVDAVTINTDLKAYCSRDGGTTWTQLTLVDEGDYETGKRILSSAAVAISAQPAGTSMKWKVETLNNKDLKLHAVGVNWD